MRFVRGRQLTLRAVMLTSVAAMACPTILYATSSATAPARISPSLQEIDIDTWGEHARTAKMMLILIQVAFMLGAAKLVGWLVERVRIPGVIGELLAGVLIGPYVLGQLIEVPLGDHWAPLFPAPVSGEWPVNEVVWSLATFASIVLLFCARK